MRKKSPTFVTIHESTTYLQHLASLESDTQRSKLLGLLQALASGQTFDDAAQSSGLTRTKAVRCMVNYKTSGLLRALDYNAHPGSKLDLEQQMKFAKQGREAGFSGPSDAKVWIESELGINLSVAAVRVFMRKLNI